MDQQSLSPLTSAVAFYTTVTLGAEAARRVADVVFRSSTVHKLAVELIGTTQLLACVIEHGVIVEAYGPMGFFFAATVVGFVFGATNRGAACAPLVPIEKFCFVDRRLSKLLFVLSAQILGAMAAINVAWALWSYSASFSEAHARRLVPEGCFINHFRYYGVMLAFEVVGAFILRTVLSKLNPNFAKYLAPLFLASVFTFAMRVVGDSALDPLVATTLFFGCAGLTSEYFIVLYWICPTIGWLLAAQLDRSSTQTSKEKLKKN